MASSTHPEAFASPRRKRNDFFAWTAVAMLVFIALGFGKSFYVRPWFNAKPLPVYLIVHGVTMTAWYLMFLTQAGLVAAGRSNLHRKLGIAGGPGTWNSKVAPDEPADLARGAPRKPQSLPSGLCSPLMRGV